MSLREKTIRGLKWQAIEIGGRQLLSLVVFTTLARLLDPAAFGLVGLVGVYLAVVGMFVDQGIGTALVQRKELEPEHLSAAFWFNIAMAALMCGLTIVLAGPVSRLFGEPQLEPLLRWASLTMPINAIAGVHAALFTREMDFRRPAIRTFIANLAGGGVGVGMALAGYGVWALICQQLTASLAGTTFMWFSSSWRPTTSFSLPHLRALMVISLSVFATGFLWLLSSRVDQAVIGRFLGPVALGQYIIGAKLPDITKIAVHQPIGAVSMPALAKLQDDHPRMCSSIYKAMELNALVSFPVFFGLAAVAPTLVPMLFGPTWTPAVTLAQLFCMYALVVGIFAFCQPALLASGRPGKYVLVNLACAAGATIACAFGVRHGAEAVILGLILNLSLVGVIALFFLRQRIGLSPLRYLQPCVRPLFAATLMVAALQLPRRALGERANSLAYLAIEIGLGMTLYSALCLILCPLSVRQLVSMLPRLSATPSGSRGEVASDALPLPENPT